jgi:hypothetical protein
VEEWVEKYENIDGRVRFFEVYACFSSLYQKVGKCLLSMKGVGSINVECTAKPFKHCILTKDRNKLGEEKGTVIFRAGQNLKHLHHAHITIKGKAYAGVNGTGEAYDGGKSPDESIDIECDLSK